MPNDVLRVSTVVDLSSLTAGMTGAATAVESSTTRMNAAFTQVSSTTMQMDARLNSVAATLKKDAAGATEASAQIAQLQAQITQLNAKLAELEARLSAAPRRASSEFGEARHAMMGMGEMIGVHLPRYITSFLARLEGVAPLMAAAFSTVAIIGLIAIIPEVIEKIVDITAAMVGWDDAAKKAYADLIEQNQRFYLESLKTREEYMRFSEIGTTGLLKIQREQGNTSTALKMYNDALMQSQKQVQALTDEHNKLRPVVLGIGRDWWQSGIVRAEKEKEVGDALQREQHLSEQLLEKVRELRTEQDRLNPEKQAQLAEEALSTAKAVADAIKTVSTASVSFQEQSAKEMYELGLITHDQEIASLRDAENQKYDIEKTSIARRKALAAQQEKETGRSAAPELTALEAQREALEVTHQAKLSSINTAGEMERRRMNDAVALAEVAAAQKVADAKAQLEVDTAHKLRSERQISLDQETSMLKEAEDKRFAAEKSTVTKQLAIAKEYPEKNKAQIITLNAELEAIEIAHQARLQAIDASASQTRLEESRKRTQEEIRFAQESANIQLQVVQVNVDTLLKTHQIGLSQWRIMQEAAINSWYTTERAALQRELAEVKKVYGEEAIEYKKLIDKLKLLDMQRDKEVNKVNSQMLDSWHRTMSSMQNTINSGLGRALAGYETFGQAWQNISEQVLTTTTQNAMKMVEQMLIAALMHKSIAKTEILTDAKTAAANTWKSVSAIPVVGPFLAPPAAAAAFAAVLAFGSFQRGGVTEGETMAHLHPKEMVLPEHISTPLIGMLATMRGSDAMSSKASALSAARAVQNQPTAQINHTPVNVALSLTAWDGESVDRWLRMGGGDALISNSIKRGVRQGRLSASNLGR